jgi:hypothetical protein
VVRPVIGEHLGRHLPTVPAEQHDDKGRADYPRPFAWTRDAGEILASIHHAKTKADALTDR